MAKIWGTAKLLVDRIKPLLISNTWNQNYIVLREGGQIKWKLSDVDSRKIRKNWEKYRSAGEDNMEPK